MATINMAAKLDEITHDRLTELSEIMGVPKADVIKIAVARLFTMPARWARPSADNMGDKPTIGNYNVRLTGILAEWVKEIKESIERNEQRMIARTGSPLSWRMSNTDVITLAIITAHKDATSNALHLPGTTSDPR